MWGLAQTDLVSDGSVELLLLLVTSRSGLRGLGLCDPKGARCYGVSARLRSHAVKAFTQSTYWKRGSSMVMPLNSSQRKQFSTDSYPTSCPPPQKKKNTARLADTNPGCMAWRQSPRELPKFVPCSWAQHPSGLAGASSASLIAPSTRSPDHSLENPFSPPPGRYLAILQGVRDGLGRPGKLPLLSDGHEAHPQPLSQRGAYEEAAGVQTWGAEQEELSRANA